MDDVSGLRGTGHRARGTGHKARGTEQGAQGGGRTVNGVCKQKDTSKGIYKKIL